MFSDMMKECCQRIIRLKEVDAEALKTIIQFCETKKLAIDAENVLSVAEVASMLQFDSIVRA